MLRGAAGAETIAIFGTDGVGMRGMTDPKSAEESQKRDLSDTVHPVITYDQLPLFCGAWCNSCHARISHDEGDTGKT
jgi:hypothetical protein